LQKNRKRVIFDDPILEYLTTRHEELKRIVPSISFSRTVNISLKEHIANAKASQ